MSTDAAVSEHPGHVDAATSTGQSPGELARQVAALSPEQRQSFDAAERLVVLDGKDAATLDAEVREKAKGRFAQPTSAASITPVAVNWLWRKFVPLGAVSLIYGTEGDGKSTLTNLIAAQATRGKLPGDLEGTPVNVEIVAFEDDPNAILRPRLEAAGADLDRVFIHGGGDAGELLTLPDDVEAFGIAAEDRDTRLVIIDPLPDALREGLNENKNADVRRGVRPLQRWAQSAGVAVIGVAHPNKGATDAANKVNGSKAWRSLPRSVMIYGRDPSDADGPSRILAVSKANYTSKASVRVKVDSVRVPGVAGTQPRANIEGESEYRDADVLLANSGAGQIEAVKGRGGQQAAAEALIYKLLEDGGGTVESTVAYAAGEAANIPEATMRRARQNIGVQGRGTWTLTGLDL